MSESTCPICGKTFQKSANATFDLCPECIGKLEEKHAQGSDATTSQPKSSIHLWLIAAIGVVITLIQFPKVQDAIALLNPPPASETSVLTDPTQQCISNLWEISSLIQAGQWPPANKEFSCPIDHKPYRTQTDFGDQVVFCPNPSAHGFKMMRVSRNFPTPQTIK